MRSYETSGSTKIEGVPPDLSSLIRNIPSSKEFTTKTSTAFNPPKDEKHNKILEIILSILLSVSLSSFLLIIVDKLEVLQDFIFALFGVTGAYVLVTILVMFVESRAAILRYLRAVFVILFSLFPFMLLRKFVNQPTQPISFLGLYLYSLFLCIYGTIWCFFEGGFKDGYWNFESAYKDVRFIVFLISSLIIGYFGYMIFTGRLVFS